jgi:hypothetical protein
MLTPGHDFVPKRIERATSVRQSFEAGSAEPLVGFADVQMLIAPSTIVEEQPSRRRETR